MLLCLLPAAACGGTAALHGTVLTPPAPAHRFTLRDQDGVPFLLAGTRPGITALYFGFTHCKDVCPQTLEHVGAARERAGLTAQQLQIVMVTVDPSRDTPAAMRAFFGKSNVRAIGLSGTPRELARVYRAYGVAVQRQGGDIGHSDYVYVLDKSGAVRELLSSHASIAEISNDLQALAQ